MTGKDLRSLMRRHKVTIREAARRIGVTMKRVRFRRESGIDCPMLERDWIQAITGTDPGPIARWVQNGVELWRVKL